MPEATQSETFAKMLEISNPTVHVGSVTQLGAIASITSMSQGVNGVAANNNAAQNIKDLGGIGSYLKAAFGLTPSAATDRETTSPLPSGAPAKPASSKGAGPK